MFAVIKTGGKQYRVAANDLVEIDKIDGDPGASVAFADVLMVGGDEAAVGAPTVAGASVSAEIVEQARKPKVIAFKKRRRKNSRRKRGHRQDFTLVRITEILTAGGAAKAKPKPAAAPKPAAEAPTAAMDEATATATAPAPKPASAGPAPESAPASPRASDEPAGGDKPQ